MNSPEAILKDYKHALTSQLWDNVSPFIHEDACMIFTNGTFKGKSQIQEIIERNFKLIENDSYEMKNIEWLIKSEHFASCIFEFTWDGYINGEYAKGGGRGSLLMVYENENWKIMSEHLSPHPPQQ